MDLLNPNSDFQKALQNGVWKTHMPIVKVKGGYRWGSQGKVYKSRSGAEKQAAAAYASGYGKNKRPKAKSRKT